MSVKRYVSWFFRPETFIEPSLGVSDLGVLSFSGLGPRGAIADVSNMASAGVLNLVALNSGSTVAGTTGDVEVLATLTLTPGDPGFNEVFPISNADTKATSGVSAVFTTRTLSDEVYEVTNYIEVGS